ncbi:uncharacterized protein PHALS_10326 [Plasmopara halstedii]|uniref:Uncharacterized protein n=1 Tax=Plasmopara halstedii TaxID=4781 RepID=A0A0P1AH94_PLAHL|nr:uncharacterized protein PHALS_10326 [Plasmopara halstedii]CEG40108.1 hypothetical protein PHALS_10326 [Plasmopara halstedii]|eukprot:XP_024576477.1 hypothetical protein PHALS_10326 [Plasmopara halstedii]
MSPQVNTPVVAEVVGTPAPSVIEPVEASNVKVSEVPNVDESIVEPMIADSAVYKEEYNSDSEQLYNSDDSKNEVTSTDTEVIKPTEAQLRRWAYLIVSVNYLENRDEIAEAENLVLDQQQIDALQKFVEAHTKKNAKGKDIESTLKRDSMVIDQFERKMKERKAKPKVMTRADAEAKGTTWDTYGLEYGNNDILKFSEVTDAWRSLAKELQIDHQSIKNADPQVLFSQGYISPFQLENRKDGKVTLRKRIYFKSDEDKETFLGLYEKLNLVEYCVANELYDQRLQTMLHDEEIVITIILGTWLAAALKVFNDWETSKYYPKLTESQIQSIVGGTDPDGYNEWKAKYEPLEVKEKNEDREKRRPLNIVKEKLIESVKDKY